MGTEFSKTAKAFARRDLWIEGLRWFEEAARRHPDSAEVHAHLGFFCVKESRYDTRRGLREYDAALRLDPACVPAHLYRAVTLAYLKRTDDAREALRRAAEAGAARESLLWAEGSVELEAGSIERSRELFHRLVDLRPDSGNLLMLSKAYAQGGDCENGVARARKAAEADPDDFRPPVYVGIYLAFLCRFSEARESLEKAEAMNKNYPLLHHTWAYIDREQGRVDEAERRLREVLRLDQNYVTSRKMLGDLCASSGRVEEAREHFQTALALFPDYAEAREALGRIGGQA